MLLGAGFGRRFPGLDESFAGVLMIGYHAMEGTPNAVLAHTYSPWAYRAIRVNGQEVGEITLDAAVAGELGVPLIFVASDELGCQEAKCFMPWVETVATKQGFGRNCASSKHPAVAGEEIFRAVQRAVDRICEMKPLTFAAPMRVEIEFKRFVQAAKARIRRKLEENYERFPMLKDRRKSRAGELSGGMQRMVELGRALMTDPKVILVDEPTAGLAKLLAEDVYQMLVGLRDRDGMTIVLVDQQIRQALKIADYVYVLELGHNKFEGPVEEFSDLKKAFWA